mgnify:CR=1 FL=1
MNHNRIGALLVAATFLCSPVPGAHAAFQPAGEGSSAKVNLRPRFTPGQEIRYMMELEINSTAAEQVQKITQEIGLLLRVKDTSPESGSTLELVYESLKLSSGGMLGGIEFDGAKPRPADDSQAAIHDMLKPIIGLTLTIKMDRDGNISSVTGGGNLPAHVAAQFTGADGIKNLVGPITSLNKSPGMVAVGESWHNKDSMQAPMGTMNIATTHTLKRHKGADAEIEITGTVTLDPSAATGLPQVAIKDSTLTGIAHWDTEVGMLKSMETNQRLSTEQVQDGQTIKSTQTMSVKVKRR